MAVKGKSKEEKNKETSPKKAESTGEKEKRNKANNKLLVQILIGLGIILIIFFSTYFFIQSKNSFNYHGVKFIKIQEGELTFYNTQVQIYAPSGSQSRDYNFYLRTDPRELEKMEFNGTVQPLKLVALNYSNDLDCRGYGTIAITNMITLYQLIGAKITIDKNATCDPEGRYILLSLRSANETSLEQVGKNCFNMNINNCEVFPPTERFMLETFVKLKQDNIRLISS